MTDPCAAHLRQPGNTDILGQVASASSLLGTGKAMGVVTATSNGRGRFVRVERDNETIDRIEALCPLARLVVGSMFWSMMPTAIARQEVPSDR